MLGGPDLSSRRWVWEQYDTLIQGNSLQRPGGDAGVVRVDGHPTKALAFSSDVTPRYCEADPYEGGKQAVAECWRNLTATGAEPLAATDNLNFGNPERPEIMGQFVMAVKGIGEACRALDFPIVSGNVSLYNETNGRGILPTPTIGGVGLIRRLVEDGAHRLCRGGRGDPAGRRAAVLGQRISASRSICATSMAATDGPPPPVDLAHEKKVGDFVRALIVRGHRDRRARPFRRRPCGGAGRDGDGLRHRRDGQSARRRRSRSRTSSARTRAAIS